MQTKALLLATALLALVGFSSTSQAAGIRIGNTPASRIAKAADVPGKGVYGKCLPFALALHQKFQAAGIPSRVIAYRYEKAASASANSVESGHAIVAYEDGGRTYVIDNQSWAPQWVYNGSPAELARQFSGIGFEITQAKVVKAAAGSGK